MILRRARRRRLARWCAGLVLVAACAGLAYETAARGGDAARFPAPGRLVNVGGHRLHLHCTGTAKGRPAVVLEAGLVESGASWAAIQRRLAGGLRVCSYDRAGYAWSEDGPGPRTAGRAADELRALLAAAGEPGPYVLAGYSYGGEVVRLFAARHPDLTAGLVLIDVTDENAAEATRVSRPLIAAEPGRWGSMPVVVIVPSGQPEPAIERARRLAARSARGRLVVADTPEHYVQHHQPDLVAGAILETAASGRG